MKTPAVKIIESSGIPEQFYSVHRLTDGLEVVPVILAAIRRDGDSAIRTYAATFDRANPATFEIPRADLEKAEQNLKDKDPELYNALVLSRRLAMEFAATQRNSFQDFNLELAPGLITGQRTIAVERAGVYVPAGRFPLFSSVIMGTVPALAAGVKEVILCTPPAVHPSGNPELPWADERIMAVASLCGVKRVFAVGGAQAIAAMAYGTQSIPKVNVIVGPGNKYVAEAKKQVYGEVGIDLVAGPTEVMIIADEFANPAWVAADLIAQAEHDVDAQAVLLTMDKEIAAAVARELETQTALLEETSAARVSLSRHGYIIIVKNYDEAIVIANRKAPEHLELAMEPGSDRECLERNIHNYGSVFIGHRSAEVLGDYSGGLNHTLPTSGSASFTGGLSVRHFLKTTTTLRTRETGAVSGESEKQALSGWTASVHAAEIIARAEGLNGHAAAARYRRENN